MKPTAFISIPKPKLESCISLFQFNERSYLPSSEKKEGMKKHMGLVEALFLE